MLKKIIWVFKRHPFLYYARFKLLSRRVNPKDIADDCYNVINKKEDMPSLYVEVNKSIAPSLKGISDLEKAKQICRWLNTHTKSGSGLSLSSEATLKIMLNSGGGVCSDMAQVFNNFCVLNDIKVREWGITMRPFDKEFGGHSINEVYCTTLKKWVLLDVANELIFYKGNEGKPLSVIEFFQINDKKEVSYVSLTNTIGGRKKDLIDKNFFKKNITPFLISNYSNKMYDKSLQLLRPTVPVFIIHFLLFLLGKSYYYKFVKA